MTDTYEETFTVSIERNAETGQMLKQVWRRNGRLGNTAGPAVTTYDPLTGNVVEERWMRNNQTSRLEMDGPAVIQYDPCSTNPVKQMYFADGNLHRISGPAVVVLDAASGQVLSESFFRHDKPYAQPPEPKI